jgi:hypothetical protein
MAAAAHSNPKRAKSQELVALYTWSHEERATNQRKNKIVTILNSLAAIMSLYGTRLDHLGSMLYDRWCSLHRRHVPSVLLQKNNSN